jgi:hypothetical protein
MNITDSDLTILMQGPIVNGDGLDNDALQNIERTMSQFPGAEFIVSTWRCSDELMTQIARLDIYHKVRFLFNEDPGSIQKTINGITYFSNINRMIASTFAGLNTASRTYIIKIRIDSFLYNNNALHRLNEYVEQGQRYFSRNENYSVFSMRVINCNLFARDAKGYLPFLYHPGDILFLGLKDDLIKLFNIDPCTNDIFSPYYRLCFFSIMKLVPEQYLWVNCIKKIKGVDVLEKNQKITEQDIEKSESYYVNNFICYSPEALGLVWLKHKQKYHGKGRFSVYSHKDWLNLYRQYISREKPLIDGDYIIKKVVTFFMTIYFFIRTNLLRIHFIRKFAVKYFVKRGS